jgi:hypothetical protein
MTYTTNPRKVKEYKVKLAETVLDLPVIVERLQALGFHDVNFNDPADIKLALAEWFAVLIDEINESPEDFIRSHCTKHFDKMLPNPCDFECYEPLCDDDDYEVTLPIVPRNPVVPVSQAHLVQAIQEVEIHSVTASLTYSMAKVSHVIR